jgi:hypothetical protein
MTMNSQSFKNFSLRVFNPFLKEIGFSLSEIDFNGKFYSIYYDNSIYRVVLSFEPGDSYLSLMLQNKEHDDLTSIDNPEITPRLNDMNLMYMKDVGVSERRENDNYFSSITPENQIEKCILKLAKDLRLVLPKYLRNHCH